MKAISTRYLSATNTKPSRIKVSAEGVKSITYTCDELEGTVDNIHIVAAKRFAKATGWSTKLASGGLTADSWVHCFIRQ